MITVVLVRPQNPENLGFIARAMANFDFQNLILIDPLCDKSSDESIKTSKHAHAILKKAKIKKYNFLYGGLKKEFGYVVGTTSVMGTDYNIRRTPILPDDFSKKIKNRNAALVFGNEGTGLLNEEIAACDYIVTIPTSKKYPAMNISHACAILLYELFSKGSKNQITDHILPASRKEREILMETMHGILDNIDFPTEEKKDTQKIAWERIFEKSMLSKREAFAAIGLLRKIKNRLSMKTAGKR